MGEKEGYWAVMLLMLWMAFGGEGFLLVLVFDLFRRTTYAGLEWTFITMWCYSACILFHNDYPMECLLICWAIFVVSLFVFFISFLMNDEDERGKPSFLEEPLLGEGIQKV